MATVKTTMKSIPITNLIMKMTEVSQSKRIRIEQVEQTLATIKVKIISKTFLISIGFPASIFTLYRDQNIMEQMHHQVTQMFQERYSY